MTDAAETIESGGLQETSETDETVSNPKRHASQKRSVFLYRGSYEMAVGHMELVTGDG